MTKACLSCVCWCACCSVELQDRNAVFLSSASAKTSLQSIKSGMPLQRTNPCVHTHSHAACHLHKPSPEIAIRLKRTCTHRKRQQQLYLCYLTHSTVQEKPPAHLQLYLHWRHCHHQSPSLAETMLQLRAVAALHCGLRHRLRE